MKACRILGRSIRDAVKSIIRNFSLSMASILCDMITLIIVSVAIIIACNVNNATKSIESEMNIVVYFNKNVTDEDSNNAFLEIKNIDGVSKAVYKSKDEWKTEMSGYSDTFDTMLNYLSDNPLMNSCVVYVDDIKEISEVAEKIKSISNVEVVKYGESMVEEIVSAFDLIQKITIGIVIALVLVTVFLISNTIKLTIYSRKNEIEIMRLVGASNTTIKLPFLFEGLFLGLIGSIIPVCITIYGYVILYNIMHGYMFSETLNLIKPYNFVFYISGIIVLLGAVVGMFGSTNSVRKYLKV
ncbi:MAG: permease-like cell division protein FtsX [Bacilli bacterium]